MQTSMEEDSFRTLESLTMRRFVVAAVALGALLFAVTSVRAEGEGQADLDAATDLQVSAESLGDLEKVTELLESALKKGLDKGQEDFAKRMLAATLYQHANVLFGTIENRVTRNLEIVRKNALKDLEQAKQHDPELPDVHLLLARLHGEVPGGDPKLARQAIDQAIKLLKDQPPELSKAYLYKGRLLEEPDAKLENFDLAVKADPENLDALRARGATYLERGEDEKGLADLTKVIEKDGSSVETITAIVELLGQKEKFDDALKYADKVVELKPDSAIGYRLKGNLYFYKDDDKTALEHLNKALDKEPDDLDSLYLRAQVYTNLKENEKARADIEKAIALDPQQGRGLLIRSALAAQQKRFAEAVADIKLLLQADPKNELIRLQLASYYVADKRPRKAIELLTAILDDNSKNSDVLRARGDAQLSVGKHAEAIADYERALKIAPEDTGVLNNLAWVLATSPEESVRNAERSIELATKACELTEYKAAHILSTLASGYAEKGDWETAIKWSTKAVEVGAKEDETSEQLKQELESYKQKKPWREKQEIEENTAPLEPKDDDLET